MMGYQLFKEVIANRIIELLPPLFRDYEAQIHMVKKVNQEKEALVIVAKEREGIMSASPVFYLEDMYELFRENQDIDAILEKIAGDVVRYTGNFPCEDFNEDISARKDHIIMSLVNTARNEKLLENIPHDEILDLSVIYRVIMQDDKEGVASIILTDELMKNAGISREELGHIAYENTRRLFPAEIFALNETLHVMSNRRNVYGAATILYREYMEELAEHTGGDFYIIPTSIHEVMAVPVKTSDLKYLVKSLAEGNRTSVSEQELLSNTIYHYDRETGNIRMAASYFAAEDIG